MTDDTLEKPRLGLALKALALCAVVAAIGAAIRTSQPRVRTAHEERILVNTLRSRANQLREQRCERCERCNQLLPQWKVREPTREEALDPTFDPARLLIETRDATHFCPADANDLDWQDR